MIQTTNNKEKILVDIILPNYNKGDFIEECISSIFNQTFTNWNLFIIDDNSNDNSKSIINKYLNKNVKLVYLKKNKGVSFCRNLAIRLSNSKYISFIDADDYWSHDKLEKQVFFMEKHNYEFSYSDYTPFILKNKNKIFKKIIKTPNSFNFNQFIKNTSIGMSSVILRRSILGTIKFPKVKICEDYYFKCQILKKNILATRLNENTMYYRISKNSLQSNKLRNIYWLWFINKKYNQLSFFNNFKSIFFIAINSIKKYGIK